MQIDPSKVHQSLTTFIEDAPGKVHRENALANLQYFAEAFNNRQTEVARLEGVVKAAHERIAVLETSLEAAPTREIAPSANTEMKKLAKP